jgi:hypothetical protein
MSIGLFTEHEEYVAKYQNRKSFGRAERWLGGMEWLKYGKSKKYFLLVNK